MEKIIYKDESFKIIGKCMEVHNNLGPGFLEIVIKMHWNMNLKEPIFHLKEKRCTK